VASKSKKPIQIKSSKVGSLRSAMGAKKGQDLSMSAMKAKLSAAKKSGNAAMVKKLNFAINARSWSHK